MVVDPEPPAGEHLAALLHHDPRIRSVTCTLDGLQALRLVANRTFHAVFLDVRLPGLDGLETAWILNQFGHPPAIVFVTAQEQHAVEAFTVGVADYLLKPVSLERITLTLQRIFPAPVDGSPRDLPALGPSAGDGGMRGVDLDAVQYIEAQGDYVRAHTDEDSFLLHTSLTAFEERWKAHDFFRIHRHFLVSLHHIHDVQVSADGRRFVTIGEHELPVSRRQGRELGELLSSSLPLMANGGAP